MSDRDPAQPPKKKKTRVLKAKERNSITTKLKSIDSRALLEEIELYQLHRKGRDKYSYLFHDWLRYQLTFTTTEFQDDLSQRLWDALASCHQGDITKDTKRVILCDVLNGVQSRLQQVISTDISETSSGISILPTGSDDVSLYRLGGWALLSAIKYRKKELRNTPSSLELQQELKLLQSLTASQEVKTDLPAALRYLDRGRLTFPRPSLIPFLRAVEDRMLDVLNETNYKRYGKRLFEITKITVLEDLTLQQTFQEGIDQVVSPVDQEIVDRIFSVTLLKVFNARCNEYLRAISNDITRKDNKTADVHIGLRDKLKTYAAEKQIPS